MRIASRARSRLRDSSHCAIANRKTTVPASLQSPRNIAPMTATSISALMSSARIRIDATARRAGNTPPAITATRQAAMRHESGAPSSGIANPAASASPATSTRTARARDEGGTRGASCSSHARMPVSATASTIALVDRTAASYFTCRRWPTTSADTSSIPGSGRSRRCRMAASSPQHIPSTRKTDSACTAHRVQRGAEASAASLIWRGSAVAATSRPLPARAAAPGGTG